MIVFGDRSERVPTATALACLLRDARSLGSCESTCDAARNLCIRGGMIAQALMDCTFEAAGQDEESALFLAASELCLASARPFVSQLLGHAGEPSRETEAVLLRLSELPLPRELLLREPEGFSFYALYPELYVWAAQTWQTDASEVQAIGIRSIGTSLAAVISCALPTARLPIAVRPTGHPFARTLCIGPVLEQRLLSAREQTAYAVVDEGPGLSGSSFLAVVEWLEARGVPRERIALFPSHGGEPGRYASEAARRSYRTLSRVHVPFEERFLSAVPERAFERLGTELEQALGTPTELVDLGAGAWRAQHFTSERDYPASHVQLERRKYLWRTDGESFLLKYLGFGQRALRLEQRARLMAQHGLTPALVGVYEGFMVTRWLGEARPLSGRFADRAALVAQVSRYLAFRARRFAERAPSEGASPDALMAMVEHNTLELLGPDEQRATHWLRELLPEVRERHTVTATDNKLDLHEWLLLPDGRLLKTDALDHCCGHDCIGCQDPAWDLVAAQIELELDPEERERLRQQVSLLTQRAFCSSQLSFYAAAYLAFRAGQAALSAASLTAIAPQDAERFAQAKSRYAAQLAQLLWERSLANTAASSSRTS